MPGWDDTPAPAADGGWQADGGSGGGDFGGGDNVEGGFQEENNVSMHANGDSGDAPADGGCRVCGQDGHFARDCPDKPANDGACFGCGEQGHNRADCPSKPPDTCKICKQEGHKAAECEVNRMFSSLNLEDISAEEAWKKLEEADKERDVDDIKRALLTYAKAYPEVTFEELEQVFRDADMHTHLIAKKQEVSDTHTIVNLQGKIDQDYVVSIQFSNKPRRAKFAEDWPSTPEENTERLIKAGLPMDRMVPKCSNCDQMGHGSKQCPEERMEREKQVISCANCNNEGHRARDCTEPRKSGKRGCKNCGQDGHIAKECPEPPNPENVECKNCGTMGHFSRDCPDREPELCRNCNEEGHRAKDCTQERKMICRNCDAEGHTGRECPEPKNMAKVQCRNCDEFGHESRGCPKPTDWSRVECSNCHEKGHSYKRCTKEAPEPEGDGGW